MKHLIHRHSWPLLVVGLLMAAFTASSVLPATGPTASLEASEATRVGAMTTQQAREDLARRASRWHTGGSALQIGDFTRRLDRPQPAVLPG